jgi:hypothetical protein
MASFLGQFRRRALPVAAGAVWLASVAFGMSILWRYAATPGQAASPPLDWPAYPFVQPPNGRYLLAMFAHAYCPCSKASVNELAIIMARTQGKLDAHVFVYTPPEESTVASLRQAAEAIPGVRVIDDPGANLARRFGAFTSGQTLLYSPGGRLVFNGGITASRGHSGDNAGRQTIVEFVHGQSPLLTAAPVFGCSLRTE